MLRIRSLAASCSHSAVRSILDSRRGGARATDYLAVRVLTDSSHALASAVHTLPPVTAVPSSSAADVHGHIERSTVGGMTQHSQEKEDGVKDHDCDGADSLQQKPFEVG